MPHRVDHQRVLETLLVIAVLGSGLTATLADRPRDLTRSKVAAREEAISYAAYRLLVHRFQSAPFADVSLASFDARMEALGFDPAETTIEGPSPPIRS